MLNDVFNIDTPKKEIVKSEVTNLPAQQVSSKDDIHQIKAISELNDITNKGKSILENYISLLDEMEFTSEALDPKSITAIASLINALSNAQGKILNMGQKEQKAEKIINNTQNNILQESTSKDSNKIFTTDDIIKGIGRK